MYVVVRIDKVEGFGGIAIKRTHIYSRTSKVKETMVKYYKEIKEKYPDRKVVLTTEEKALEAKKFYQERAEEKERIALGLDKRISVSELNKELNNTYVKHLAKETCGRR